MTTTNTGISLVKGQKVDFSKDAPSLKKASILFGWDTNESHSNSDLDLYINCFLLDADGLFDEKNMVYFQNTESTCQSVKYIGNNDERFNIDLSLVPNDVKEVVFVVSIYDADQRRQNFGHIKNCFVCLFDTEVNAEVLKYTLTDDYSTATAIQFCKFYRYKNIWKFEASGIGKSEGFKAFLDEFQQKNL